MTCDCQFGQFLQAFKEAFCMPEFPVCGGGVITGTTVNAGTTAAVAVPTDDGGTEGPWTELIAATPFQTQWVAITLIAPFGSFYLIDIGVGAASSEVTVIADLVLPANSDYLGVNYLFPIDIPAGSRVSARAQEVDGVFADVQVKVNLIAPTLVSGVTPACVASYGSVANTKGTNVDPGGTANTKSSWVEITAATTFAHHWLVISAMAGDLSSSGQSNRWLFDVGIGAAGSEIVLIGDLMLGAYQFFHTPTNTVFQFPVFVPPGSRLSVRAQSTSITDNDRDLYVRIYGA